MSFLIFIFGLVFGSFLNVCIHRMPREESIVKPGSHCPECKSPVRWFDNVPLVSYFALGGRCRHCREKISPRYFLVEFASGLLWVALWLRYGFSPFFFIAVFLISVLLAISASDLETGLIPDKLTLPGMGAGLLAGALFPALHARVTWFEGLTVSGLGLLAGGGSLLLIGLLGNALFKKESMGGGDIKLLAMLGSFLGMKKVFLVLLFGPMAALPFAVYAKFFRKAETIPFGPYLAVTGALMFLFGDEIAGKFFVF